MLPKNFLTIHAVGLELCYKNNLTNKSSTRPRCILKSHGIFVNEMATGVQLHYVTAQANVDVPPHD